MVRCDGSKKCSSRQLPAFGQSPAKSPVSLRKCTPKKCLRPSASGCLSTPTARLPKRPAAITRKRAAPESLRLLVNPFRKISPVARCDDPKKCSSRRPLAFGQSPAKSSASLRKCAPKKCSRQTAFGFWSILCKKPLQPSELYPEKIFRSDSFRLWVNPLQKVPSAFGNVPRKNVYARPPPAAFPHRPRGSLSGPLR